MILTLLFLALSASDPGVAALQAADARVATIAWQLQTANAPLCSETALLPGFTVQTLAQYQPSFRALANPLGRPLERRPIVQSVIARGPAGMAGLEPGDVLLAVAGSPTPRDLPDHASYDGTAKTQAMIDAALQKPPLVLHILHDRVKRTVSLGGVAGCASRVEIVTENSLGAQADGQNVQITGSLVDFAANDDELATIIAHELAHNILHHGVRIESEKTARGLFARFGKRDAGIQRAEIDADRMAVWLMARAGYDVDAVVPLWARLGQQAGTDTPSDRSHPDWSERIDRAAAAVAQLKAQRSSGAALLPTKLSP